jgi:hypothetical protein
MVVTVRAGLLNRLEEGFCRRETYVPANEEEYF